jgi:hypothetical protein
MSRHLDDTGTGHPILGFLDVLEAGLDDIADTPAWSLSADETAAAVTRLVADLARLAEVETRLLGQIAALDLPADMGVSSTAKWLARTTRQTKGEARRRTKLAETLQRHEQTRQAVASGAVLPDQAVVIGAAVDALDDDLVSEREAAEAHLIEKAAEFDADHLRRLGEKLFEVLDPEGAEAREAKRLEEQEARARQRAEFRMWHHGDGTQKGTFVLPDAHAEMLRAALNALASPKHVRSEHGAGSYDHAKPSAQRMGWAFIEYVERYPSDRLAQQGGMAATVVVTVEADVFTHGTAKAGTTTNGVRVSPGQLLRWACEAGVMPAVLDKTGHVLDLGRRHRLHTPAQRLALIIEQKTCQHPACDIPGAFCHVHHTEPWSRGGETNTRDAVLLCPFHHHQAHAQDIDYPIRT